MKERDTLIKDLYADGYTPLEISERAKCSIGTIYNALKRLGVSTRNYCKGINKELREEIIERYKNFESVTKISREMGIYPQKVRDVIKGSGIENISYAKRFNNNLLENYFETIDSKEKAYWLGWLITDGCVSKNSISMSLQGRDLEVLKLFEKDLGLTDKVKVFNKNCYRFSFCCKKMVDDLEKFGIIPNKTFTVDIPSIEPEYYPALLRGCFEGDGGITVCNTRGRMECELSFTGNEKCVNSFNDLISMLTGIPKKNVTKNNGIFRVRWSNKDEIVKIFNVLYKDCGEHLLKRKYLKLKDIQGNTEITLV